MHDIKVARNPDELQHSHMTTFLPLVSIAIPTYNRAEGYLRQTIEAALRQDYPEIEVIVADNCSSDNTEQVVRGFEDRRIRYFRHPENLGWLRNFNSCLEQARGAYFMLLPDDDLIDSDFVDSCLKAAKYSSDIGIIRTGTRVIDGHGAVISESRNLVGELSTLDLFLGWFHGKTSPYLCSTLFSTGRLREIGGFEDTYKHFNDVAAHFRIAAQFSRIDIQDVKASYRIHDDVLTFSAKLGDWCDNSLQLLDLLCSLVPESTDLIRANGMPFLARLNYNRAMRGRSAWSCLAAYFLVFRKFGYRHRPSRSQVLFSWRNIVLNTLRGRVPSLL